MDYLHRSQDITFVKIGESVSEKETFVAILGSAMSIASLYQKGTFQKVTFLFGNLKNLRNKGVKVAISPVKMHSGILPLFTFCV